MKLFQNFKLVTQILCFIFIIMILCLSIQLGAIYLNFYYFEEVVLDSTLSILNKQFKAETKSFSFFSQRMIEKYQQREKKRLESINMVYQFTWDLEQIQLFNIEQCLNTFFSKYSGQCSLCYGVKNLNTSQQEANYEKYLQIANLYSVILLMADNTFDILFAGSSPEQFIALWPPQELFPTSFNPQTRPWYLLEYAQSNTLELYQTHFTQPYIHASFKSITVSHTQSLYDKDFRRIGVVTIQLNFSSTFPNFLQNHTRIKCYLLDENYYILQGDRQSSKVSVFFDQNITGFNASNFNILDKYLNQGTILQSCTGLNKELLCLHNVQNQEFIVEASKLSNYNQIFLLAFDPTSDLKTLENRLADLSQEIQIKIQIIIFQTLFPNFSFLIFSISIIFGITNRISSLTLKVWTHIFKDQSKVFKFLQFSVFNIEQKQQLNALEKLEIAFANLNDKIINAKTINPQCLQMINSESFPKRIMKRMVYWQYLVNNLQDKNLDIPKKVIQNIISQSNRKNPQTF